MNELIIQYTVINTRLYIWFYIWCVCVCMYIYIYIYIYYQNTVIIHTMPSLTNQVYQVMVSEISWCRTPFNTSSKWWRTYKAWSRTSPKRIQITLNSYFIYYKMASYFIKHTRTHKLDFLGHEWSFDCVAQIINLYKKLPNSINNLLRLVMYYIINNYMFWIDVSIPL